MRQKLAFWANVVNANVIARASPRAAGLVSKRVLGNQDIGAALRQGGSALTDLLASQRSALLESTRLVMHANASLSTSAYALLDDVRGSSERSVEMLIEVSRRVATYRELGPIGGAKVVAEELLRCAGGLGSTAGGLVVGSVVGVASLPFTVTSRAVSWAWSSGPRAPQETLGIREHAAQTAEVRK